MYLGVGVGALEAGEEGVVDVDHAPLELGAEGRAQDLRPAQVKDE